jgi:glutathione S-transferase
MITLYGAGPFFGLPDGSTYVMKTEMQLRMAGLPYRKLPAEPDQSPKGQIPFIEDGGVWIADSTFIRLYLENTYGIDFDEGLDARGRAEAWTVERMMENHLYWAIGYFRWLVPENFERGPAHFFDAAPAEIRAQVRRDALRDIRAAMKANGIGRHSEPEIVELAMRSLTAISTILGDKAFLMGERPCGADATLLGMLTALYAPMFPCELRARAERLGNLVAYADRLMARFFPEFDWGAEAQAKSPVAA